MEEDYLDCYTVKVKVGNTAGLTIKLLVGNQALRAVVITNAHQWNKFHTWVGLHTIWLFKTLVIGPRSLWIINSTLE